MGHGGLHFIGFIPTPPYSGLGMRVAVGWPCGHVKVQLTKLLDSSDYMWKSPVTLHVWTKLWLFWHYFRHSNTSSPLDNCTPGSWCNLLVGQMHLSESYQLILTVSLVPRLPISSLLMAHPINAHHETSMLPMRAKWKQAMAVNGNEALVSAPNLMWVSAWQWLGQWSQNLGTLFLSSQILIIN